MRAMLATSLIIGLTLGWLSRGSLRNLVEHRIAALWLPWVAVVLQVLHFHSATTREFFDELGVPRGCC
jgi:hypothetical protein